MATKYWIKLYHEVLHDPKMGRLSDHNWRRAIEVFLLAGECNEDGYLPAVEDMAWELRADPEELLADLETLRRAELIERTDEGEWLVSQFAKRQSAMSSTERSRRHRERQRQAKYYGDDEATETEGDATEVQRNRCIAQNESATITLTDKDKEEDTDTDKEEDKDTDKEEARALQALDQSADITGHRAWSVFCKTHEKPSTRMRDQFELLVAEYPTEWLYRAMVIADRRNKPSLRYVGGILRSWQREGAPFESESSENKRGSPNTGKREEHAHIEHVEDGREVLVIEDMGVV